MKVHLKNHNNTFKKPIPHNIHIHLYLLHTITIHLKNPTQQTIL